MLPLRRAKIFLQGCYWPIVKVAARRSRNILTESADLFIDTDLFQGSQYYSIGHPTRVNGRLMVHADSTGS